MFHTPSDYETIMANSRRFWYAGKITTVAGDVYEFGSSNVVGGTGSINRRITDGTSLSIGSVTAAQFDVKLYWQNIDRYELYDAKVQVSCFVERPSTSYVLNNWGDASEYTWDELSAYEWEQLQSVIEIPMGEFYINEVTQNATTISITAFDALLNFDAPYVNTVASKTPYEWISSWCSICNVTLGTTEDEIRAMPNGTLNLSCNFDAVTDISTYRDVLSYLCTALCAVAVIGRDGRLYIVNYGTTPAKTFDASQRYSSTLSDYVCYYTHLTTVYAETVENYVDTSYTGEDDGITLDIDVNPFLQIADTATRNAACQAIITKLATVHYAPYEVTLPARPELDIMDVIGFTGGQADVQDFGAVMDITYNFDSSMSIACAGDNPKTITEDKYVKTIRNVSRIAKQNDNFAGLLSNAYGMYRTEIEDPVITGAYAYALHNAKTYNESTFAMLLNANGLYVLRRNTPFDEWTITTSNASDGAAFVETLSANIAVINSIFSKDITVTGALHSDDYIPAATGASPPYAQQGMGLDFGEKEFEAEHFAVDAYGRMWATEGKIGPFYIGEMFDSGVARPALYSDWYVYKQSNNTYERSRVCIAAPRINYTSGGDDDRPVFWAEVEESFDYDPLNPEAATWTQPVAYADISGWGAGRFRTISAVGGGSIGVNTTWGLDIGYAVGNTIVDKIGDIVADYYNGAYGLMIEGDNWLKLFSSGGIQLDSLTTANANVIGNNYSMIVKDKSIKSLTTVSSNYYGKGFYLRDSADYDLSYLRHVFLTDNRQGVQLETRAVVGGSTKYNTVNLYINNSTGEKTVQLSDPHAWCKAMLADHVATPNSFFALTNNHASCGWTTMIESRKALFNENLASSGKYLMAITDNWEKGGYVAVGSVRNLIGAKITQLYSGTFKSGTMTFNANHDAFIIVGTVGGGSRETMIIPKAILSGTNTLFLYSDDDAYTNFNLKYSESTATLTWNESKKSNGTATSGYINKVYGLN